MTVSVMEYALTFADGRIEVGVQKSLPGSARASKADTSQDNSRLTQGKFVGKGSRLRLQKCVCGKEPV
jgi:hypothetical protein